MTDQDILQHLQKQLENNVTVEQTVKKVYADLVTQFPESGFFIEFPDADLPEPTEKALRELASRDYLKLKYQHLVDGWTYMIDLRGDKFYKLQNNTDGMEIKELICDSGQHDYFVTGVVRDSDSGKPRPDLISPFAMERLAEWLRLGATKYSERNWEKGIPVSRCLASLYRHLLKFQQGRTDEDHIAAILCNAMFIAHTQEMVNRGVLPESLLDIPDYTLPAIHQNKDEPLDY
jgi:hypothetical protein